MKTEKAPGPSGVSIQLIAASGGVESQLMVELSESSKLHLEVELTQSHRAS